MFLLFVVFFDFPLRPAISIKGGGCRWFVVNTKYLIRVGIMTARPIIMRLSLLLGNTTRQEWSGEASYT